MRVGEAEGDPEGDGRRTLANGWESRLWRLEDKHLREGSSVRQFERPRPLRIRHRRRRKKNRVHDIINTSLERCLSLILARVFSSVRTAVEYSHGEFGLGEGNMD